MTKWTLPFLIGTPVWILWLLGLLVFAAVAWRHRKGGPKYRNDYQGWGDAGRPVAIGSLITFALSLIVALSPLAYYPYEAQYHQWQTVSGKVEKVDKRLIAQDKAMSERFVLIINGQPYGVDDTRAATVEPGDTVSLWCKRDWQYASVPGWVCRWNS